MDVETQRIDSGVDPSQLRTAEIVQKLEKPGNNHAKVVRYRNAYFRVTK